MKVIIKIEDTAEGVRATVNNKDNGVENKGAVNLSTLVGKTLALLNTPLASTLSNVIVALDSVAVEQAKKEEAEAAANDEGDSDED